MKQKYLFITLATLSLIFTSCGGNKQKAEAEEIILYTNKVVEYVNNTQTWLNNNERPINTMVDFMENRRQPMMWPKLIEQTDDQSTDFGTLPSALSEQDKAFFTKELPKYTEEYAALKANAEKLNTYLTNETFRNDDYTEGTTLANKITDELEYLTNTKKEISSRMKTLKLQAENILIEDHPLKDPIKTLRSDIEGAGQIMEMFVAYNAKEVTPQQIDSVYQIVSKNAEENSDKYTRSLKKEEKASYEYFYKIYKDNVLKNYKKNLKTAESGEMLKYPDFKIMESNYKNLVKTYNTFISQN